MKPLRFWGIICSESWHDFDQHTPGISSFHKYPLSINYVPWMLLGFSNIVILYLMQLQCEETDCK